MQRKIHRMQGLKLLSYTSIFAAMPFQLAIAFAFIHGTIAIIATSKLTNTPS